MDYSENKRFGKKLERGAACATLAPQALMAMIMLPSSEPEELGGSNIPVTVQNYVKSVSVCFDSPSLTEDMPSILPAPLQRAEVAVMIEQLKVTLHHTSLLLLSNEKEGAPTFAGGEATQKLEHFNR